MGWFPERFIEHNKFLVGGRIVFYDDGVEKHGVVKGKEQDGCYPISWITNDGHREKESKEEFLFPAQFLQHANTDKIPIWSRQVRVAMVNSFEGDSCVSHFTLACGQDTTVESLKKLALKVAEKRDLKSKSQNPEDFKFVKLLSSEEVENDTGVQNSRKDKAKRFLDDKDLMWNSFADRTGNMTVVLMYMPHSIMLTVKSKVPKLPMQQQEEVDPKETVGDILTKSVRDIGSNETNLFALTRANNDEELENSKELSAITKGRNLELWLIKRISQE